MKTMVSHLSAHRHARIVVGGFVYLLALIVAGGIILAAALAATPHQAYASSLSLTAQNVRITLPSGETLTVPDGSSIDLSGTGGGGGAGTKATTAKKRAAKAWKKSGLAKAGKKYGWTLTRTLVKATKKKAVYKNHFSIAAAKQKRGKHLIMDVYQNTYKKGGKWKTIYKVEGGTYVPKGIKMTLRDQGKK